MEKLLKNLDSKFQEKFGEEFIHNSNEAKLMGEFVLDLYASIIGKTKEDYGYQV